MAAVEVPPVQAEANGNHAKANGNTEHVDETAEQTEQTEQVEPEQPKEHRLYFVRIPRPTFDDSVLKKLETELSACFTKLKAINSKAQVKRGEANELRKQLGVARSLRNGSSPEFEEKMTRLKQLREMRKSILDKISEHKQGRQGLECRSEQELDDKIAEMEHSIQLGEISLAEEKATVRNIAKLKSQREKIRELEGQQEGLAQMEAEARKIKAVIDEVDSEMNILRGERDQAKDIIDELSLKLQAVNAVLGDYDAERQDLEATKREIQDQLKATRDEIDTHMFEYRANRKLSLQLRDLVAEGKLEEAQAMAEQQTEAHLSKILRDAAYRKEYFKLWSEQRKYLVSELLPNSGAVEPRAAPAAAGKGKGGKRTDKPAAPLVPQGAAKAQAIIAAALAEAELAVAAKRKEEPAPVPEPDSEEHSEEPAVEAEPAVRTVPGATDEMSAVAKAPKHSKPAFDFAKAMSEMPEVHDYEYIMPPTAPKDTEQLSAAELKVKIREEQRQKAAEAEARKKRRQEQLAKKQALAKQKAAEQAAAAATATNTAPVPVSRVAVLAAEEVEGASGTDVDAESGTEQQVSAQPKPKQRVNKHLPARANKQLAAAAKKPVVKKPVKVQKWYQQYATELAVAGVCLLMLILLILYFTTN
jgi:uncharacterized coiled-coil DUF342 family protein